MISDDVVQENAEITKIHRFEFFKWKYNNVHFYTKLKFTLKGKPNDDLPIVTSIFKKVNNIWEINLIHRFKGNSDLSLWD